MDMYFVRERAFDFGRVYSVLYGVLRSSIGKIIAWMACVISSSSSPSSLL